MLAQQLRNQVDLSDSAVAATFFMVSADTALSSYEKAMSQSQHTSCYQLADALSRLMVFLLKQEASGQDQTDSTKDSTASIQSGILNLYISAIVLILSSDHASRPSDFGKRQKVYFRLLSGYLLEFHKAYKAGMFGSSLYFQTLVIFGKALETIAPSIVPGFAFSWLGLLSHRYFFPKILTAKAGWPLAERLLVSQLASIEPFIIRDDITDSLRFMYGLHSALFCWSRCTISLNSWLIMLLLCVTLSPHLVFNSGISF